MASVAEGAGLAGGDHARLSMKTNPFTSTDYKGSAKSGVKFEVDDFDE